jgi:GTP-binding protein
MGRQCTGANGDDIVIRVPVGTVITNVDTEEVIGDLTEHGQKLLVAKGGIGGRGNIHFKSSTNRAPRRATPGTPGEEREIRLELKLLADVGLLGFPNAGKSTFIRAVSAARPKVADYPFTTLHPNLGVVRAGDVDFVLADIPGLIEGAHDGAGLGDRFLGHIERCRVLLHLVDATSADVATDYKTVRRELKAYGGGIDKKKEIVALSKSDALDPETLKERHDALKKAARKTPLVLSAVSRQGVQEALYALAREISRSAHSEDEADAATDGWQP